MTFLRRSSELLGLVCDARFRWIGESSREKPGTRLSSEASDMFLQQAPRAVKFHDYSFGFGVFDQQLSKNKPTCSDDHSVVFLGVSWKAYSQA